MTNVAQNFSTYKPVSVKIVRFYTVFDKNIILNLFWCNQILQIREKVYIFCNKFSPNRVKIQNSTKQIIISSKVIKSKKLCNISFLKYYIKTLSEPLLTCLELSSNRYVNSIHNNQKFIYFNDG